MPAFTFEKISPPISRDPSAVPPNEQKPRGVIQVLGRFVEKRVRRVQRVERWIFSRREQRGLE